MIKSISIGEILNSRKEKIIHAVIRTEKGTFYGNAPSGASTGKYEAKTSSNKIAIQKFDKIKNKLTDEKNVDGIISKLPANISTPLSIAAWKANARYTNNFPYPLGNVIGGGAHGGRTSIQEFLVCPLKAKTMKEAVETNKKIHAEIGKALKTGKNYEGAWKAKHDEFMTLDILSKVAEQYGARIGVDVAATQLWKNKRYNYSFYKFKEEEHIDFILDLIKTYKLFYVEDPFHENDFASFKELKRKTKCLIVGDDLTTTNPQRLVKAKNSVSGIIIKVNQIGTVSKALETIKIANQNKIVPIISHRSGETIDPFIADFAIATRTPLVKCGVFGREREAKTKRLIELWKKNKGAKFSTL